jgi:hypothetical protein
VRGAVGKGYQGLKLKDGYFFYYNHGGGYGEEAGFYIATSDETEY